ncbi:hypothetical protein ABZ871_06350 [Streptomyces populi]
MRPDDWHLTEGVDRFLTRAGDFPRSRPGRYIMQLTWAERVRKRRADAFGAVAPLFGMLERGGEVQATFYRLPPRGFGLSPLTPEQAALATRLAALGHSVPHVSADHRTAAAFAEAWRRHTGATPKPRDPQLRLYRLGTLTLPEPMPAGRGRVLDERNLGQVMFWWGEFARVVGENVSNPTSNALYQRLGCRTLTDWTVYGFRRDALESPAA